MEEILCQSYEMQLTNMLEKILYIGKIMAKLPTTKKMREYVYNKKRN